MATKAVSPPKDNMALGLALVGGGAVILLLSKAKSSSSPTLKVTPTTISPGGTLNFTFDHFPVGVSIGVASPACSQAVIVISNSGGSGSGVIVVDTSEAGEFVLNASVIVGTKTYTASANFSVIVGGWMPALKAIPSATATSGPPQVGGWIPALTMTVSAPATHLPAQVGGWIPALAAVVSTSATNLPPPVSGWLPALSAIVPTSVRVRVTPVTYSVVVEVLPDSTAGSVSPSSSGQRNYGDQINFSETPKSGYTFTGWFINGVYEGQSTSLLVTIVGNTTVSANFQLTSSNGPAFPAPSSDTSWYWVKYTDGSVGWDDVADVTDFYQHDPNSLIMAVLHGPYAPGATG